MGGQGPKGTQGSQVSNVLEKCSDRSVTEGFCRLLCIKLYTRKAISQLQYEVLTTTHRNRERIIN